MKIIYISKIREIVIFNFKHFFQKLESIYTYSHNFFFQSNQPKKKIHAQYLGTVVHWMCGITMLNLRYTVKILVFV